jgi:hypothetical protein
MHVDCSQWKLEPWERDGRIRQWYFAYCVEKFLAHSLGRPSIIPQDSWSVPVLAEQHMEEGSGHHLIYLCHLAGILSEVLHILYSPRTSPSLFADSNKVLFAAIALMGRLDQFYDQLPTRLGMQAPDLPEGYNSNGFLHLSYAQAYKPTLDLIDQSKILHRQDIGAPSVLEVPANG